MYDTAFWVWFIVNTATALFLGYAVGHMHGNAAAIATLKLERLRSTIKECYPGTTATLKVKSHKN